MAAVQQDIFAIRRRSGVAQTFGELKFDEAKNQWRMTGVPPDAVIRLKHLFPRISKVGKQPFMFEGTGKNALELEWFLMRYPMAMSPEDQYRLECDREAYNAFQHEMERILAPDYVPPAYRGFREGSGIRDYQARAVELLLRRGSLLCGDVVGLGKTFVGIGAALKQDAGVSIVITEPHVQKQWVKKFEDTTMLGVHAVTHRDALQGLPQADVYCFRYSNIDAWIDVLASMQIGLVCWDEIQKLRRGTATNMGTASKTLADLARYRLGLTATPIYNYGREIFNVLRFIDETVLGAEHEFRREWVNEIGHLIDAKGLGSYLRNENVFLRRTRQEVGRELPPPSIKAEKVDYDKEVVRSADDLAIQLALQATRGSFVQRGQAVRDLDALVRHRTGVAKAKNVALFVKMLVESGEKVLLTGWHRDVYEIWLDELAEYKPVMYTGSETAAQKEKSKQAFIEGDSMVLIMSNRSGAGTDGIQDVCSVVVIGELDWSHGIHEQIIGRVARDRSDGEVNHVLAFYMLTDEGSDPAIVETLGIKSSEARQVVDPGLGPQPVNNDESAKKALVQRYLAKHKQAAARAEKEIAAA